MATFNKWYSQAGIILLILYYLDARDLSSMTNSSKENITENGMKYHMKEIRWKRENMMNNSIPTSRERTNCMRNGGVCNTYHGSWSSFYLKIGGWLMLGIVLVGISCLVITHYLGMKKANKDRRKKRFTKVSWTDAKTKSKLAKWMG
ncbi:uncharacterized protein LOC110253541 [Exaiptasia diaphana]|uniref:Uncharacterized protein n=1 Tax=Exaiptasia diaphana TaxID=2652724 RepID=A0A913Y707_EXADI|nr:uncharacterized protein LOC110253541 [Exaiptasia diaphana]KXJ28831.1 hypothetical protein AC249_AIPGENE3929 [Exaiptasia diaphana]